MKTFLNDSDGLTIKDLEKIVTCILFILGCLIIFYMYLFKQYVDTYMIYFTLGIGTLFISRKIFKYNLEAKTFESSDVNANEEKENKEN